MQDHIVVDVEIKKTIQETPGGWESTHLLGVACAVVYEYRSGAYRVYGDTERDLERLRARILAADRVSGFNTFRFDFPCIFGFSRTDWDGLRGDPKNRLQATSNDLLRRIWEGLGLDPDEFTSRHRGWSLNNVSGETLGRKKIGNGADAPEWYQNGEWGRVVNYCLDDVKIEKGLTDFIDHHGYVLGPNRRRVSLGNVA
jgi:DEAD/DEAH box helicase domain-containing protein